jgi:signal transduction histidine kinase
VVAVGIAWAFLRAPRVLYPDVVFRLQTINETTARDVALSLRVDPSGKKIEPFLRSQAASRGLRIVIITGKNHRVLFDTGGPVLPYNRLLRAEQLRPMTVDQVRTVRPQSGGLWLYSLSHLEGDTVFLVLSPAPNLPLGVLFSDQFFSTFFIAGLAALALAFGLALALGNWVAAPLRRMVTASQAVARGDHASVPVQGPAEVQELARAMNEMSRQVQVSQQSMLASQQSMRDFVANVSHELKTPLTSIQGFAQAIQDGTVQTSDALQQAAGVIYNEAARMHRLVLDLLSLARLEAGTADLQQAPVNLNQLLESLVEKLAPQAQAAQVRLQTDLQDIPTMTGDGDRLAQVFTNLLDNAIKFTPPGGYVTASSRTEDGAVLVSITDTGQGIALEDQARIFERFYQVDKSRRGGMGRGVGLGLAIARQVVLAHEGKIWVESQPGQGSRFVVKLPQSKHQTPVPVSTLTPLQKGKR